ncbi:C-terminal binding protein (plasmid) [Rhodobacteraceae bacterium M382]|nr:C-terminal binding protein [Rhodobacteraceae bacterium M382]
MKIAFTDFVQPDLDLETALITDAGLEMVVADPHCTTEDEVIALVKSSGADAIVSLYAPITEKVFAALPNLRIVSVPLVGVDAIDMEAAGKHGVWIAHIPDAWVSEVGVHAAAMALSLVRHLPFYDRSVRERRWNYEEPGVLHRTHDMTFGLMGCGRIGQQAARSAAPSFGKVIAYDPYMPADACPDCIAQVATIEELFERAHVVSLHSPLTAETKHIVNADLLDRMQKGSFIVNASRGALIDPNALLAALDSGQLGGAGLDVFEVEPPNPDDPLLHHPRTVVSPHAAYYSVEADEEGRSRAIKNVITYANTGAPDHYVVKGEK